MDEEEPEEVFYDSFLNDMLIRYKELIKTRDYFEYNGNFDNNKRFFLLDNIEQEIKDIETQINNLQVN